jgi:hypothetical protein
MRIHTNSWRMVRSKKSQNQWAHHVQNLTQRDIKNPWTISKLFSECSGSRDRKVYPPIGSKSGTDGPFLTHNNFSTSQAIFKFSSFYFITTVSNPIFANLPKESFPAHESLKDLVQRTVPFWVETVEPQLRSGKRVLVVAHGTSLRGLVKHVKNLVKIVLLTHGRPEGVGQGGILPQGRPIIVKIDGMFLGKDYVLALPPWKKVCGRPWQDRHVPQHLFLISRLLTCWTCRYKQSFQINKICTFWLSILTRFFLKSQQVFRVLLSF